MIRMFDLLIGSIALLLFSPLLLLLIASGCLFMGSPIFKQTRVGLNGKPFSLFKFRSLPLSTADMPTHLLDATAIPPFGRFLRKTKLDELPQLFCVIKGDMSLVGPRPGLPSQRQLLDAREQRDVLSLRPGITGLSQIRKIDMSTPVKLARFDAIMRKRWSVRLYLYILFMTLLGRGAGDRVKN